MLCFFFPLTLSVKLNLWSRGPLFLLFNLVPFLWHLFSGNTKRLHANILVCSCSAQNSIYTSPNNTIFRVMIFLRLFRIVVQMEIVSTGGSANTCRDCFLHCTIQLLPLFWCYHRCIAEVVCNDPSQHIAMRACIHNFIKNIWDAPLGKTSLCPVWGMFFNSYVKHGGELAQNTALILLEYYGATGCICWFHNLHSLPCLTTPLLSFFFIISCVNSGR